MNPTGRIREIIDEIAEMIISNSSRYSESIRSYYYRHRCRIIYNALVIDKLASNKKLDIIEVGPYPGILSLYLAFQGHTVDIIEYPRPEMEELDPILRDNGINNIVYHDLSQDKSIESLGEYDLALMFEVIEHIPAHPVKVMKKINHILKKKGILLMSTPNMMNSFNRVGFIKGVEPFPVYNYDDKTTKGHFREYSKKEIEYILERAGFKIESIREMDKSDYCREVGIDVKQRVIERIKIGASRAILKTLGKGPLKAFLYIKAYKLSA